MLAALAGWAANGRAQEFEVSGMPASIARWMYPFNSDPGGRATASVFGALGSTGGFDSRDAQFVLGWNTTNQIPAGAGASNYFVRRARVTLTISSGQQYAYTGKLRDYRTYFPTNDSRYVAPTTSSSPVELFGTGFRGGFTAETYEQTTPYHAVAGAGNFKNRTAYAAAFDRNGVLVDVSNNVGDDRTNEIAAPFEVAPFAVGQSELAEGELMPVGSQLTFDLNLGDPFVRQYLREALDAGRLLLTATSFASASRGGPPTYPNFYTPFSAIATPAQYPRLEIEGALVRAEIDSDDDSLPDDWESFYFNTLAQSGTDDPDTDGASNVNELRAGTDPSDGASVLKIISILREGSSAHVNFSVGTPGDSQLESSENLGAWQPVNGTVTFSSDWLSKSGTNIAYPSEVYGQLIETNVSGWQQFFRIQQQ
jgi:hypothetical protein